MLDFTLQKFTGNGNPQTNGGNPANSQNNQQNQPTNAPVTNAPSQTPAATTPAATTPAVTPAAGALGGVCSSGQACTDTANQFCESSLCSE